MSILHVVLHMFDPATGIAKNIMDKLPDPHFITKGPY
jgi:hypothetical protein